MRSNEYHLTKPNQRQNLSNEEILFSEKTSDEIYEELNKIDKEADNSFLWQILIKAFKVEITICFLLVQSVILLKVAIAFAIGQIFETFSQEDKTECYLYVMMMAIIWLTIALVDQSAWRLSEIISIRAKGAVIYILYKKILNHSNFNIGGKQRGQIINSIIEFHDILENNLFFVFTCLSAPLGLIGFGGLLVWKIGWIALVGIFIPSFFEFIHYHYANYNSGIYEEIATKKDERVRTLSEVIAAFRYIKTQGWSSFFIDKIKNQRTKQKSGFISYGFGRSLQIAMSEGVATVYILIVMYSASKINDQLNSTAILQGVLIFLMLKLMIIFTSYGISCYYLMSVIFSRIVTILKIDEARMVKINNQQRLNVQNKTVQLNQKKKVAPLLANEGQITNNQHQQRQQYQNGQKVETIIMLKNFYASYSSQIKQSSVLKGVNLSIKKGQFIGVYGKVGSGKSSLLYSMAKMMPYYSGQISIAELSSLQQSEPALFSGSIEDNVLFGLKKDENLYRKALRFSCLDQDISSMALGDQTQVEEGALNLSGGQRTRICLARVIYADRPILLLDDPLSSLDLRVIHKVVENLSILGKSEGKTIILATHHISSLKYCDQRIEISSGNIFIQPTINQSEHKNRSLYSESEIKQSQDLAQNLQELLLAQKHISAPDLLEMKNANLAELKQQIPKENIFMKPQQASLYSGFIVTFLSYLFESKRNYLLFALTLFCYIAAETLYAVFILFLDEYDAIKEGTDSIFNSMHSFWLTLTLMSVATLFFQVLRTFFLNSCLQFANQSLHNRTLEHIFKAQVLQLDKMGSKSILDKFSADLGLLDVGILPLLSVQFIVGTICCIQIITIAVINPIILPFAFCLALPLFLWYLYCNDELQELKNADMIKNGEIIQYFSETLNGLTQISQFNAQETMINMLKSKLTAFISATQQARMINRVYTCLCLYITSVVIICTYFGLVAFITDVKNLMFAATFLIDINQCAYVLAFNTTKVNAQLVSYKRMKNLQSMISEKQGFVNNQKNARKSLVQTECRISGYLQTPRISIALNNYSLSYGSNLALKSISIEAKPGEKIALIGRTGSGKSSVVQGLLRLVEPSVDSQYLISEENALKMDVAELRQQFACIPQTPFLFNDTLRRNLDPFGKYSDIQIEDALRKTCILDYVRQNFSSGLDTDMCSAGSALSTGQKQLICFARVVLEPKKFLILDEATANIDHKTDQLIQAIIRSEFAGVTVISVAHRLSTIIDYDRIIVLSHGSIVEQGTAADLWKSKGQFYNMIMSNPHESKAISNKIKSINK